MNSCLEDCCFLMKLINQFFTMNENSTLEMKIDDLPMVYRITCILLLIVEIPSIICTFLILIFIRRNWDSIMTRALHNHAIFLLMIISLLYTTLDLPFIINHYRLGYDIYRTLSFCTYWYWLDYTLMVSSLFLTAIASIQRHILVFNSRWLQQARLRRILHYFPLAFCLIYPGTFFIFVIVLYSCSPIEKTYCSFPCYSNDFLLFYVDWIINVILPIFIIVLANIFLICRSIYSMKKFSHRQSQTWRKRRKLILQLFSFSTLYVIGWGPSTLISIIETLFLPDLFLHTPNLYYINNSSYFVCPLQPFICLFALPELLKYLRRKFHRNVTRTVSIIPSHVI